jgi:outer membrane protein TolC
MLTARVAVLAFLMLERLESACISQVPTVETSLGAARTNACATASLTEFIRIALERNPEISAAQSRYEAAVQRPRAEAALPDPMIGLGYNASGYPLPGAGLGKEPVANIGFMVTQEIPYPGKRGLRAQMAKREAQAEWSSYEAARLAVVARVKQTYYRLQHGYQALEVIARNRQALERMLEVARTRYSVGKGMQSEILGMQTQLSILEAQRLQAGSELRTAEAALNALLDRPPGATVAQPEDPGVHESLPSYEELLSYALTHSPMVTRDRRMIERAETGVAMARKEWYPDLAITAGYYNMGAMPPMYMFRADVRLPLWGKRQRAGITESAGTLSQTRRTYRATEQNLANKLREDYEMARTARELLELYARTVIPQANLAVESGLATYQAGGEGLSGALRIFMTGVEYEMNYHEQMLAFHLALVRLEEMSGMPLTPSGLPSLSATGSLKP